MPAETSQPAQPTAGPPARPLRAGPNPTTIGSLACAVGLAILITGLTGHKLEVANLILGVLIVAVGVRLLARGLPGSRLSSRGRLRATDRGIVIPGAHEITVPWRKFERLQVSRHGTRVDVYIRLTNGDLEAVPSLSRRDLYTRRAHARATLALQALETELQDEQTRQLARSGRK